MTIRIGVLSDTHGLLRPEVLTVLQTCDYIVHAGDVNKPEIVEKLRAIAPLYIVRGNNDKEWAQKLSQSLSFSIEGVRFFLVHNKKEIPSNLDTQVIIFGHSHQYFAQEANGQLWLNPGSCGPRRFQQEISLALLTVSQGAYRVEKILISPSPAANPMPPDN